VLFSTLPSTALPSGPPSSWAVSAIAEAAQELGGALGIAVLGSVLNSTYRNNLELPAGVPAEAASQIRESLGGALEIAATLPGRVGEAVAESARQTFVDSMQLSVVIGAVLLALLAGAVLFALRDVPKVILDDEGHVQDGPATVR
jgi:DHA2 family multidrug resistance protein-like MFS transporter